MMSRPPDGGQQAQSASLRIGVDGRAFTSPAGGVRRYIWELTRAMLAERPSIQIVAIGLESPRLAPGGVIALAPRLTPPSNLGWALVGLPMVAVGRHLDVFHAPAYTAPLVGLRPRVVTVHDVSYARSPQDYPYKRDRLRRWFYRQSAIRADAVITDSHFSRIEIMGAYEIPETRITVVPLGVGHPFRPGTGLDPAAPVTAPFVLHVGDLHSRRRPGMLLEAVLRLRAQHESLRTLKLVLAGRDHGMGGDLRDRAAAAGAVDAIVLPGVVSEETLVALLQHTSAFVYASRYEGFGLPLLEAMACGAPVVALRAASVEEVVGPAAVLLDASAESNALADALAQVLLLPDVAHSLRTAGLSRAASFTWQRTAAATLDVYERVRAAVRR